MAVIAGKVAPRFMGAYNSSTTYQFYDAVTHNNKLYFCKKSGTVGKTPTGATDDNWFLSLDGTFADAASLGGETAAQWQTKIDNIQTTSRATLSQAGWYRVAEYDCSAYTEVRKGLYINGCDLYIKQIATQTNGSDIVVRLLSRNGEQRFVSMGSNASSSVITKIRYTYDSTKAYLEVYYGLNASNLIQCTLSQRGQYNFVWTKLDFVPTSETVDGVTVTTTYDIPANASPVTTVDDTSLIGWKELTSGFDLNNALGRYRSSNTALFSTFLNMPPVSLQEFEIEYFPFDSIENRGCQVLKGRGGSSYTALIFFRHKDGTTFGEWKKIATTADLANYFENTGGNVNGNVNVIASDATARNVRIANSVRAIDIGVNSSGGGYITDVTNNEPLCEFLADGRKYFHGTATGNLPISGGTVKYLAIDRENNTTNEGGQLDFVAPAVNTLFGANVSIDVINDSMRFFTINHDGVYKSAGIDFNGWSGDKNILHTGNVGEYALPKNGDSTIAGATDIPLKLSTAYDKAMLGLNPKGVSVGAIGADSEGKLLHYIPDKGFYQILDESNSAKVAIQSTAPTDTSALWVDTANKVTKAYIDGAWTQVA